MRRGVALNHICGTGEEFVEHGLKFGSQGVFALLVGHDANYSLDNSHAEPGLLYSRKQPAEGNLSARLTKALQATLRACQRLETEPSLDVKVSFRGGDILLIANDLSLIHISEPTRPY